MRVIAESDKLEIRFISEEKGRGVFAKERFLKEDIIERCPYVFVSYNKGIEDTELKHYLLYNIWDDEDWKEEYGFLMFLGYGMLYNHSDKKPNMYIDINAEDKFIFFRALKVIEPGEELVWNYSFEDELDFELIE